MTKLKKTHTTMLSLIAHVLPGYILPKIHKNKDNRPGRPIVSASSHPTERISEFVDYQLNPLVPKLPSYIKDTTHFLQKLDSLPELSNSCLLVTLDVSSLNTNIPHKEGIHACRKALESRTNTRLKTESISGPNKNDPCHE